ncbi:hypothetical protein CTAYLR_010444 [Chrysophaeum taylorii]|uniref:subtilisin n=1 Tax=Chrysophaeum taylorii TaxID=2483200 RepID=A0AAD7U7T9_9STRA|nr:hypothetical protein CTAYLR_010444 [Chrysophaeum taylorii]
MSLLPIIVVAGAAAVFKGRFERLDTLPCGARRTFREAGKFEARRQLFGLHLWYDLDCEVNGSEPEPPAILAGDPLLAEQTSYKSIRAPRAWRVARGEEVVVQIVDTGIDDGHEDLRSSLWTNPGEIPGNNIDDDKNGYVDDVHGYNFADDSPSLLGGGLLSRRSHGSHVAGTVGATWNNSKGGRGVSAARLMIATTFGNHRIGGFAEAIAYAAENGARISSNSWSYRGTFPGDVKAALDYFEESGGIAVFAAGNDDTDLPVYPAAYARVVAVGATDDSGVRYYERPGLASNFGPWVNLTAPGVNIFSTQLHNGYGRDSGTSMACPHVAGAIALAAGTGASNDKIFHCLHAMPRLDAAFLVDCVRPTHPAAIRGIPWMVSPGDEERPPLSYRVDRAGVRCCSEIGGISLCDYDFQAVPFATAEQWCAQSNLALCTIDQLLVAQPRGTGCRGDHMSIWAAAADDDDDL